MMQPYIGVKLPRYDLIFSRKLVYSQDFIPIRLGRRIKRVGAFYVEQLEGVRE